MQMSPEESAVAITQLRRPASSRATPVIEIHWLATEQLDGDKSLSEMDTL